MKHIKKKHQFESKDLPIMKGGNVSTSSRLNQSELKNNAIEYQIPFLTTTNGTNIWSVFHKKNNKTIVVPLPDLTLVYFNYGYINNKIRKDNEKKLFEKLESTNEVTEEVNNEVYNYFGAASSCIIGMFTSLESFINSIIPDDVKYERILKQKKEFCNKEKIQRWINFDEKIKEVVPIVIGLKYDFSNSLIPSMKELRDKIIHTKSSKNFILEQELTKELLVFNYDKCLEDVKNYIQFYKKGLIEDCDCGKDF
jgi:hypothetical protein